MHVESDCVGRCGTEEVAFGCVENHVAEIIPCFALSIDILTDGYGTVATLLIWCDVEDEFAHEDRVRWGNWRFNDRSEVVG